MDRCRCLDYEAAVKKLKLYTVGTYRPELIENYDRSGYAVSWMNLKPKARKILAWNEIPGNQLSKKARQIEQMWCPFMSPYVPKLADID